MEKKTLADVIRRHRKVCWYPSAGMDFRALLFLSQQYCDMARDAFAELPDREELPDLFVLTDVDPFSYSLGTCVSGPFVYENGASDFKKKHGKNLRPGDHLFTDHCRYSTRTKTDMVITEITELEPLGLKVHPELLTWPDRTELLDRALLLRVRIWSKRYLNGARDEWEVDMVYAFAENTAFAMDFLLKNRLKIDWLVCIRYGNAMGGSNAAPSWLKRMFEPLGVDYLVAAEYDLDHILRDGVPEVIQPLFQDLPPARRFTFKEIHEIDSVFDYGPEYLPGGAWSGYGNVHWLRVLPRSLTEP